MPQSDDVKHTRQRAGHGENRRRPLGSGRMGIPVDLGDASSSILSPFLTHLPSLSGIQSLKGFLPASPSKATRELVAGETKNCVDGGRGCWQEVDLGDGRGESPLLLITTKTHPLRIFSLPSPPIPTDPHVIETFSAPEEIFFLPDIPDDESATQRLGARKRGPPPSEVVLAARVLERHASQEHPGVLLGLIVSKAGPRKGSLAALTLVVVSMQTGMAVRRVELGHGSAASLTSSVKVIAISISHPTPSVYLLDPISFQPLFEPLTRLPANPQTSLPTVALAGRLLAIATSDPPYTPGPDGLGSIVTAQSHRSKPSRPSEAGSTGTSLQPALLSSAVELGGGVARGVWAGIQMGARAAGRARNGRLARSAPADHRSLAEEELEEAPDSEDSGEIYSATKETSSGQWIEILDLFPRSPRMTGTEQTSSRSRSISLTRSASYQAIAHFKLPPRSVSAPLPQGPNPQDRRSSDSKEYPVSSLSFCPLGTQLFAAAADGKSFHVMEIHHREVWHLYELKRGHTSAEVCEVAWDKGGRWLGVGTGKGTVHVFPIVPSGGPPSAFTHAAERIVNPSQLYPLSTVVTPIARLRPPPVSASLSEENLIRAARKDSPSIFHFSSAYRPHPLAKGTFCQDIAIYRPFSALLDLCRLSAQAVVSTNGRKYVQMESKGSGLTEMMRDRAGFGGESDLGAEHALRARWMMPLDDGEEPFVLGGLANPLRPGGSNDAYRARSMAQAEIQTYCINPRILPSSIYLSKQVDFFCCRPTDEYTPLSILDLDAREQRMIFRHEVEAKPSTSDAKSFDEPLLSALHSELESLQITSPVIPGLPNGYGQSARKWRSAIPIRNVAAGLGEGVDRVRREYARAQHSRLKRRASEAAGNRLSFEDDAVFASGNEDEGDGSDPSSTVLPSTNATENSSNGDWEEGWEEEYRKAVEEDGGPDDLVLGLLDEEEEERRRMKEVVKRP
ncbi:hypothetical protein P7C73_g853, partial [Tremellales sp. Uapishka_1]